MELTVEALSFQPSSGNWADCAESLEEWNEAYRRVESYFSALRVENKLLLSSLVFKILGIASERLGKEPGRLPVELAAEETDRLLVSWFRRFLVGSEVEPIDRLSARGRLALLLVDTKVPWQHLFLTDEPVPEEVVNAMRTAYLRADPDFRFVEMRPRPIDLGIVAVANRTFESMGIWKTAVQWLLWIGFGLLLAANFFLTR
ncbi:MAG: hypothetical protein KA250_19635 [Verrucomicrobiales bacterium]|jgi:hypothetical protein|nr:hypothetical protein [Verrucomicrobiales bacterium]MBP9225628.1 hypothetical protein [Verrucomicrobiales bacterium]